MVPMPAVIIIIACKTAVAGPPDQNADFTGSQNLAWATENSMMVCRREEIQLYDPSVDQGAAERPFNPSSCQHAGPMVALQWDQAHAKTSWRTWRVACPTPMVDSRTGDIIGWILPDCGHQDIVTCLLDSVI